MRYLRNYNTNPYFNMAFDEYALQELSLEEPLFYLWQNRPAVIVGLNQNAYAEVNLDYLQSNNIALVRRVTGGGAVYHDLGNLNYTIVGRTKDLDRDYPEYTQYVLRALQALGVKAELSRRNDILVDGRKVSGYAKRVYKDRLMVHGTLMFDVDLEVLEQALNAPTGKLATKGVASVRSRVMNLHECLPNVNNIADFSERLERYLSRDYHDTEVQLSSEDLQRIESSARNKFATTEWIFGTDATPITSKSSDTIYQINNAKRLTCGTVEVKLNIQNGYISACQFDGDFIGNLPATYLSEALVGVRYEANALRQRLLPINLTSYFDGIEIDSLLNLLFPSNPQ